MDFDLRQWLLILGPIFIVGVLPHGYFRMRSGQNEIKMKLDNSADVRNVEPLVVPRQLRDPMNSDTAFSTGDKHVAPVGATSSVPEGD